MNVNNDTPLIFSWFDHTLNTRTNLKRIIGIRPHTTSRLNQYTVLPPLPLSILSESLIILFQPQVPQISHTLDKQGYFPSDLARIKMPFQWEDSRMLYGLQMIDMALFMCGRASGIDSAKKLNDGDKAMLKIVDVIRPAIMPQSAVWYPMEKRTDYGFLTKLS